MTKVVPMLWSLLAVLLLASACAESRAPYVRENERLWETLPEFPGAELVRVTSASYEEERPPLPPKVLGYTTNVVYRVSPEVSAQDIIDFYVEQFGGAWQVELDEVPIVEGGTSERKGTVLLGTFTRGEAVVSVNTDGIAAGEAHTYELVIDHRGNR